MSKAYTIKIFLPDGNPDGLRTIEKSGWNGSGIVFPRTMLGEARKRPELGRAGVYILLGPPEESGLPKVYVGEGDPVQPRLDSHAAKKDFWTTCVAFTAKDANLNKAYVQYIEARLISLASNAKRSVLDNGNSPALPTLSESDKADAESFLAEVHLCLPVIGVTVFSGTSIAKINDRGLIISAKGIEASGAEREDGFVVFAESGAVDSEVPSCHGYLKELRKALVDNGVLEKAKNGFVFTQDYVFQSPSTAAGVVQGRSSNGRVDWKTKDGVTLKDLQKSD
jgi:hypothetical protein